MAGENPPRATRREWIGLAVIALPCLLYSMDLTVLNLAVPHLSAALAPTGAQLLWIVDIYGFMIAGSLITMGTLGDRIGRRKLLLIGAAAFGVASFLAAFSTSAAMLIAMRALLGVAGATLAPSTLSLIRSMFLEPKERTFAIGIWVTSFSLGGAVGPLVGGVLLQHFWWGSVFLCGVPVMLSLLLVGPRLLPEFRDPEAAPIDLPSTVSSLVAVLAAIYGLKRLAEHGLGWVPFASIVVSVVVGLWFVRRQKTLRHPLVDLRLFRTPAFSVSLGAYTLSTFVGFGCYVFLAQYLQLVLGLDPLYAGLATIPSMLAFVVASLIIPKLAPRVGAPRMLSAGLLVAAVGFALLARVGGQFSLATAIVASVIYSAGFAPVVILATDLIVGSAPVERAGAASAISETSSELGGALGIAVLGSIGLAIYARKMTDVADPVAKATLGGATEVAARLHSEAGHDLLVRARDSFGSAFSSIAILCSLLSLAMAVVTFFLLGARNRPVVERSADVSDSGDALELGEGRLPS